MKVRSCRPAPTAKTESDLGSSLTISTLDIPQIVSRAPISGYPTPAIWPVAVVVEDPHSLMHVPRMLSRLPFPTFSEFSPPIPFQCTPLHDRLESDDEYLMARLFERDESVRAKLT